MKEGRLKLSIDKVYPNSWNPNVMPPWLYKKLKKGLKRLLAEAGDLPPILVRPNGPKPGMYEIIDGENRWKALNDLGEKKISVFSIKVDDKMARMLTINLNYLHGEADPFKYSRNLVQMLEAGASYEELTEYLPNTSEDIDIILAQAELSVEAFSMLGDDEATAQDTTGDVEAANETMDEITMVDVKFTISVAQARIIEGELKRIGDTLQGKNKRGRALEFMAVRSSQLSLNGDI